jgi:uncharacterized protein
MTIPEEKWKAYRDTAKRGEEEERRNLKLRFQKAWRVARLASTFLNKNFGARKVFVFGSRRHEELFHLKSDIDLAVLGLDEKHYYRAQGQLLALDPEFGIDLIRLEDVSESLKKKINQVTKDSLKMSSIRHHFVKADCRRFKPTKAVNSSQSLL